MRKKKMKHFGLLRIFLAVALKMALDRDTAVEICLQ